MPQIEHQGRISGQNAQAERYFKTLCIRYNAPENFRTNSSPLKCGLNEQFIEPQVITMLLNGMAEGLDGLNVEDLKGSLNNDNEDGNRI